MRRHSIITVLSIAAWLALWWSGAPGSVARAAQEPLLVIVGLKFPARDIRLADLKSAFRGEAAYLGDKRLIPINHDLETPTRVEFDRAILGLEPAAVGRFWVDRRIRDEGSPPRAVAPELAIRVVAALPNAITYGTRAQLNPKVVAISVDGVSAGQSDYPLVD